MYYRLPLIVETDEKTYYSCKLYEADKNVLETDNPNDIPNDIPNFVLPIKEDHLTGKKRLLTIDVPYHLETMTHSEGFVNDINVLSQKVYLTTLIGGEEEENKESFLSAIIQLLSTFVKFFLDFMKSLFHSKGKEGSKGKEDSKKISKGLHFHFRILKGQVSGKDEVFEGKFIQTERGQKYVIKGEISQIIGSKIEIEIAYTQLDGEKFSSRFNLAIVEKSDFYHLALDFGSEASQAAYKIENDAVNAIDLVKAVAKHHCGFDEKKFQSTDFEQYANDEGGDLLFRSLFYVNPEALKAKSQNVKDMIKILSIYQSDHELNAEKINTLELQRDGWIKVPNLKLLEISNEIPSEEIFHDSENVTLVRNLIWEILLESCLLELQERATGKKAIAVKATLLVPNVFSQHSVNKLIARLTEKINAFIRADSNDTSAKTKILAVEIHTISESDAAFLGFYDHDLHGSSAIPSPSQDYLVIDAGSGTIDISVIKVLDGKFTCLFRTGIAGSGQFLTYAFAKAYLLSKQFPDLDTLLKDQLTSALPSTNIYGDLPRKVRRQMEVLSILDSANKLKINGACNLNVSSPKKELTHKTNDLKEIKNIIKHNRSDSFDDDHGVIRGAIKHIAELIVDLLKRGNITHTNFQGVVFSGRAIRYDPLRWIIMRKLIDNENVPKENFHYNKESSKRICLVGALSADKNINLGTQVIGTLSVQRVYEGGLKDVRFFHPDEELFLGAAEDNYFYAQASDRFYIGNYQQSSASLNITDENTFRRIAFTHEGYYLRFESGQVEELLSSNTNHSLNPGYMVQWSLFPYITRVGEGKPSFISIDNPLQDAASDYKNASSNTYEDPLISPKDNFYDDPLGFEERKDTNTEPDKGFDS